MPPCTRSFLAARRDAPTRTADWQGSDVTAVAETTVAMGICICVFQNHAWLRDKMRIWFFFFFRKEIFVNVFKVLVQRECWGWIWLVKKTGVLKYGIGEAISSGASLFCMIYSSSQKVSDDKLSSNWNSHLTRMTDSGGWELAHIVNSKEKFTYSELEFHSCICGQTINQRTAFMKSIGFIFSWKTCSFLTYCINQGSLTDSAMQPVPALGMISWFSALLVSGFGWFVWLSVWSW